jgi:hypothetical protein
MFFNKNPTRKSEYIKLWNACKTNLFPGQTFVIYIYIYINSHKNKVKIKINEDWYILKMNYPFAA